MGKKIATYMIVKMIKSLIYKKNLINQNGQVIKEEI